MIPAEATWVRFPRYIGDAVMQVPILRLLRQVAPGPLVVWGPKLTVTMLEGQELAEALVPDSGRLSPMDMARLLRKHRALRSVHFPKSLRPALASWLARVPERIGVSESLAGLFNTHSLPFWRGEGTALARYHRVLALRWPDIPPLPFPDLKPATPVALPDRPYLCLMPGASTPAKSWPPEHFARLAERAAEAGFLPVIQGGPSERELGERVAGAVGVNACGATLREAITWFHGAAGCIGNDSGLGHLAAACGTPTLSLFGPMDFGMFQPFGPRVRALVRTDLPCIPCRKDHCPLPGHPCLRGLDPDRVWEAFLQLRSSAQ